MNSASGRQSGGALEAGDDGIAPVVLVLIAGLAVLGILAVRLAGGFESIELAAYDQSLRWRTGALPVRPDVVVVAVDDEDLARWSWPVPDGVLNRLIENAFAAGAAVVAVDIYRDQPVGPGTEDLNRTFRENSGLVAAMKYPSERDEGVPAPAAVAEGADERVGFTDVVPDGDGLVRRGLLYLGGKGGVEASLAMQASRLLLNPKGITPQPVGEDDQDLRLGAATLRPLPAGFAGYADLNAQGYQFLLDFRRAPREVALVSAREVFDKRIEAGALAGKIAFIGVTSEAIKDFFYLPVAGSAETRVTFGVVLHALAADQIARMATGASRPTRWLGSWGERLLIVLAAGLAAAGVARCRKTAGYIVIGAVGGLACLVAGYLGLLADWWLPAVPMATAVLLIAMGALACRALVDRRERSALASLLTSQVSAQVARELWINRRTILQGIQPRPTRLTATVLFVDIAGSTVVADRLEPDQLVQWISNFLEEMAEAVLHCDGVIEKFTGDGLMAVFGIPVPRTEPHEIARDALHAVECALQMSQRLARLNARNERATLPRLRCRVGIHTGPLSAGSVGTRARMQYTVIGQTANLASRLESFGKDDPKLSGDGKDVAPECRVLLSCATVDLLPHTYDVHSMGELHLKGAQNPMKVYRLKDAERTGV